MRNYCAVMPARRATSVQRVTSDLKKASKAAGSVAIGSTDIASMRAFVSGRLIACTIDLCRINGEGADGWISKTRIWGVEANEVFDKIR